MAYDRNSFLQGIAAGRAMKGVSLEGGSPAPAPGAPGDITFYDYDGTIVTSWTLTELAAATALPSLPNHAGLTCQGWNWTLADLQTTGRAMNVGAMYVTDDGKTRLYIRIAAGGRMTVPLYISQTVANGVTIDWGDGSATQTLSGTWFVWTKHIYPATGDYCITLTVADGCSLNFGRQIAGNVVSYCVLGSTSNQGQVYCNFLQRVEIGDGVTSINDGAFFNCTSLSSVTMPDCVTSIGKYAFCTCYALSAITVPHGVASIGAYAIDGVTGLKAVSVPNSVEYMDVYAFSSCGSLTRITLPNTIYAIGNYAFQGCDTVSMFVFPPGLTSIGTCAFYWCFGVAIYDFTACIAVPTLAATNAFAGIPDDCIMRIPAALFDAWSTANNWATYASKMVAA